MAWAELQRDCDDDGNGHDDSALVTSAAQDSHAVRAIDRFGPMFVSRRVVVVVVVGVRWAFFIHFLVALL